MHNSHTIKTGSRDHAKFSSPRQVRQQDKKYKDKQQREKKHTRKYGIQALGHDTLFNIC